MQSSEGRRTLRACNNAARVRCNVDTRDQLIVALQLVLELEGIADLAIQLDGRIPGNRNGLAISGEGMVGDGVVEEMVDFGSSHFDQR